MARCGYDQSGVCGAPNPNNPKDPANDLGTNLGELMMLPLNQGGLSSQQEQWVQKLLQEKEFAGLTLEEILAVMHSNPGGGNIGFYRDRLPPPI